MLFNSFKFILYFPLICLFYYCLPYRWRNTFLLFASYLLYLNWIPAYALILLWVTVVAYAGALWLDRSVNRRRFIMIWGGLALLMPLLIFKYYNFVNETILSLLSAVGLRMELSGLNWIIPVGISFFTFQAYGYLADVYYQRIKSEHRFPDFALFISFFPQIASGPISKAADFLPQIKRQRIFNESQAIQGCKFLLWGMFLKVVLADRLGLYVDAVFNNYEYQSGISCFVASILYSFQIYGDFAGYSLMAIGVAKILGFDLINNFNRPYFSTSITDFWRRWHISLSVWLRDYIYIPLGGSRCYKIKNYWNILVTFLISGIWHGATWSFIIWGLLHGMYQIIEKALGLQKYNGRGVRKVIRIFITFLLVNFAWIFFRMPTLKDAWNVIRKIFTEPFSSTFYMAPKSDMFYILLALSILLFKDFRDEFFPSRLQLFENKYQPVRWMSYFFVLFLIMLTGVFDAGQFIYINF